MFDHPADAQVQTPALQKLSQHLTGLGLPCCPVCPAFFSRSWISSCANGYLPVSPVSKPMSATYVYSLLICMQPSCVQCGHAHEAGVFELWYHLVPFQLAAHSTDNSVSILRKKSQVLPGNGSRSDQVAITARAPEKCKPRTTSAEKRSSAKGGRCLMMRLKSSKRRILKG